MFGEVHGQVTVGAENDIYIAHHLTYGDTSPDSPDLTGLIANNNIYVYRPVSSDTSSLNAVGPNIPPFNQLGSANPFGGYARFDDPQVHAAMLALNRSISVQNFNRGQDQGTLHVNGVMGQRFRGPVAVLTSGGIRGYLKDYEYDWRLRYLSPPHFLEPERTPWERRRWAELSTPDVCAATEDPATDPCLPS